MGASARTSAKTSPHWSPWLWWPSSPCSPTALPEAPLLRGFDAIIRRTDIPWDDALIECRVLHRLAHLVPGLIFYHLGPMALEGHPVSVNIIQTAAHIYLGARRLTSR